MEDDSKVAITYSLISEENKYKVISSLKEYNPILAASKEYYLEMESPYTKENTINLE